MLEEKSILGQSEMQISYILDRIIMKLERVDYAKYILVPIKSSIFSVKAVSSKNFSYVRKISIPS